MGREPLRQPACIGLILDPSVLNAAERQGKNARQVLTSLGQQVGETEVGVSVVPLIELAHGAARADTPRAQINTREVHRRIVDRDEIMLSPYGGRAMATDPNSVIVQDPEILSGEPVFRGTRVPFQALLDYLEGGDTLDEFLEQYPGVTREQAIAALEEAKALVLARLAK